MTTTPGSTEVAQQPVPAASVSTDIPQGWAVLGSRTKKPQNPQPTPVNNWRKGSAGFEFHEAVNSGAHTVDELKAMVKEGKFTKLDEKGLEKQLQDYSSGAYHYLGWYLIQETSTGKIKFLYRTPEAYVQEYELSGDAASVKEPNLPKPSTPKAVATPGSAPASTGATGSAPAAPVNLIPDPINPAYQIRDNGWIKKLHDSGAGQAFHDLINKFVKDGQPRVDVINAIDAHGPRDNATLNVVADLQRKLHIEAGFYQELGKLFESATKSPTAA